MDARKVVVGDANASVMDYPVLHFVVAHVKMCKYCQSFVLIQLSKTYHR